MGGIKLEGNVAGKEGGQRKTSFGVRIDKMNRSDTLDVVGAMCPLQKVPSQKTPALGG